MYIYNSARLNVTDSIFQTYVFRTFYTSHCTSRQNRILDGRFTDVLHAMFSASITFFYSLLFYSQANIKNCVKTRRITNRVHEMSILDMKQNGFRSIKEKMFFSHFPIARERDRERSRYSLFPERLYLHG